MRAIQITIAVACWIFSRSKNDFVRPYANSRGWTVGKHSRIVQFDGFEYCEFKKYIFGNPLTGNNNVSVMVTDSGQRVKILTSSLDKSRYERITLFGFKFHRRKK